MSGFHDIDHKTLQAMARRQDAMCLKLFGKTLNGDSIIEIEPTPDSWCGRISKEVEDTKKLVKGLSNRMIWATGAIMGAGFILNKLAPTLWRLIDK